ncbi:MAG: VIT and VWA domain-containing protein [Flavobacteriales bacterium]|nr:VIT and VWA domain-containing protein [Flavobacteriales bacterium]
MKQASLILLLGLLGLIQVIANPKPGQNGEDKTMSPYFFVKSNDPNVDQLPLKSTSADVNIAGVIADVTVTQFYKNEGKEVLEAIYVFPASTQAAVYGMEVHIGTRVIKAEIREKNKARAEYEQAKAEGKRTALLEQSRPNVFQMNVGNIMPGDEIEVILNYTELLKPTDGLYTFVYPTTVGPRYSEKTASASSAADAFVESPYTQEGVLPTYDFNIDVRLSAGMPVQSIENKTHKVNVKHESIKDVQVALDPSETNGGNRDYILEYRLSGGKIESGLLLFEGEKENFFLTMIQPPKTCAESEIPDREYIFIVDISGSMSGFPLNTSKKLLRDLILNLKPTDKFNVMLFAGSTALLSEQSMFATEANVEKAVNLIDNQRGGGGTRLLDPMLKAFRLPREKDLSRSIVVVTDGYISVEKEVFDLISKNLNVANVFTFGIGSGVNRYLLEGMAHVGQGEPMIVTKPDHAHEEAEKFRKYINTPVLTNVSVDFEGFDAYDIEPSSVPDVLAQRPIMVYGKYKGNAQGKIKLKGYTGSDPYEQSINVAEFKSKKKNGALKYLWAREKIKFLDDYKLIMGDSEIKEEVTQLGLDYNLMTAYTSFIAVDQEVVNGSGTTKTVKQPLPMPAGVSNSAVGFELGIKNRKRAGTQLKSHLKVGKLTTDIPAQALHSQIEKLLNDLSLNPKLRLGFKKGQSADFELIIDKNGNVVDVKMRSGNISSSVKQLLMKEMGKWKFENLNNKNTKTVIVPMFA